MSNTYVVIAAYRRTSPICLASFMDLAKAKQFAHNEAIRAHDIYDKSVFAEAPDAKTPSIVYVLQNSTEERLSVHAVLHDPTTPSHYIEGNGYGEK